MSSNLCSHYIPKSRVIVNIYTDYTTPFLVALLCHLISVHITYQARAIITITLLFNFTVIYTLSSGFCANLNPALGLSSYKHDRSKLIHPLCPHLPSRHSSALQTRGDHVYDWRSLHFIWFSLRWYARLPWSQRRGGLRLVQLVD